MFSIGQIIHHRNTKTIFESDNNLFCLMTMNPHPVHTNVEYAKTAKHGKILVVGTLVFSLVVGLTVPEISFNAIANLGYKNIKHIAPVFIGDTIHAESKILKIISQRTTKVIYIKTKGYDQNNDLVISFKRKILI